MGTLLKPETESLIRDRAKALDLESADQLVWFALDALESHLLNTEPDEQTWAVIERAASQPDVPSDQAEQRIFNRAPTE